MKEFKRPDYIISQLEENIQVFKNLLSGLSDELIIWRSQPEKWNLQEIVCHLYDEEREDFRARLKNVINEVGELPSIDPVAWVLSRDYKSKNFYDTLTKFLFERAESVKWLSSLKKTDWSLAYIHPKFGPLSAKLFLSNWLAHDYLHIRQITKVKFDYLSELSSENLKYAGSW